MTHAGATVIPPAVRTALYRHFNVLGQLLYVGVSLSVVTRLSQHRDARWFEDIARIDVKWFPTRREALHAEAVAIWQENPKWNRQRPACEPPALAEWDPFTQRWAPPPEIPF